MKIGTTILVISIILIIVSTVILTKNYIDEQVTLAEIRGRHQGYIDGFYDGYKKAIIDILQENT